MQFESSEELNKYVSDLSGGTAVLAFSTGKDSVATWLAMQKYFTRIVPYYLYLVPGLSFVDRSLDYYEKFFDTHIIRLPHPSFYRQLNALTFQAPENCHIIEEAQLPDFDYDDINQIIREDFNLGDVYSASGVRARDSINRWSAIKKYGPLNETRKTFYPIFDYDKKRMIQTLRDGKVKLSVDYRMFGRSFDGIDQRFIREVKKYYPDDYKKILQWFPLAEIELKRMEFRAAYYKQFGG